MRDGLLKRSPENGLTLWRSSGSRAICGMRYIARWKGGVERPGYIAVMFENIKADFAAHGRSWGAQGFWAMLVYRFGRWRYGVRPAILRKACSLLYKVLFKLVQILTGIELPCEAEVGRGFVIDHFGGIIVSGYARFGDNCRIRNGVTVGLRRVEEPAAPRLGNNVDVGAGAKLLGPITIGDNVVIGANAVVITDVPANSIAIGVPATVRPRREAAVRDAAAQDLAS